MTAEVITFGCRLNVAESDAMRGAIVAAGLGDLTVINTCAVTGEAVAQARQAIRRAARTTPGRRIVVTGCAAEIDPAAFRAMPEVSDVVSNAAKLLPEAWLRLGTPATLPSPMQAGDLPAVSGSTGTRTHLRIQTGCDHRCTFCIIPYGRGPSRSSPMGALVEEVRRLSDLGVAEVVLTGVDLTAYGQDLPGHPTLGRLVKAILRHVPGLARLRLSSLDCIEADDHLLDALAGEPRLMPHLHLSLQSGDDLILKRMKRRHGREDAVRFCEEVRRRRPEIIFGADLIAGFPTEDEAMFQRSLDLIQACRLTHLHAFGFSPRAGTPAARMPQVAPPIVRERTARLREAGAQALRAHLAAEVGQRREVLVERGGRGKTPGFAEVRFAETPSIWPPEPGTIVEAGIVAHDGRVLVADHRVAA